MPIQLRQEGGSCWFYSILNCMLLSRLGRRVLWKRVTAFYNKLTGDQKAIFDNKYLCVKSTPQNRGFVFLKFVWNFWKGKIYRKKTTKLIENLGISDANQKTTFGAYPNIEREHMLKTLQIPFLTIYADKLEKAQNPKPFTQMVIMCNSAVRNVIKLYITNEKIPAGEPNLPLTLPGHPEFELDHAILSLKAVDARGNGLGHAVSCIRLPNGEYRIIEPNGNQDPCRWYDPRNIHQYIRAGLYKDIYDWDIKSWGYTSAVYIRNDSIIPKFNQEKTPVNMGKNKEGRNILIGPKGGRYVQYAHGRVARPLRKSIAATPQKVIQTTSKGKAVYEGPDGGRFMITVKDGKRYKVYLKKGSTDVKTPKKQSIGTNAHGRLIYKGPRGGRFVIATRKEGSRYKKYILK